MILLRKKAKERAVIAALAHDPTLAHFSPDLARVCGLPLATVQQILVRLESEEVVGSEMVVVREQPYCSQRAWFLVGNA